MDNGQNMLDSLREVGLPPNLLSRISSETFAAVRLAPSMPTNATAKFMNGYIALREIAATVSSSFINKARMS